MSAYENPEGIAFVLDGLPGGLGSANLIVGQDAVGRGPHRGPHPHPHPHPGPHGHPRGGRGWGPGPGWGSPGYWAEDELLVPTYAQGAPAGICSPDEKARGYKDVVFKGQCHCIPPGTMTVSGLGDDAKAAAAASPGYFMAWYTVKSVALCAAVGVIGYMIGKHARKS